jgi:hypothetical protein
MNVIQLRKLIREEVRKVISENTYQMSNPETRSKVEMVINTLKDIDVDGETMEYILDKVGMSDQMASQLSGGRP